MAEALFNEERARTEERESLFLPPPPSPPSRIIHFPRNAPEGGARKRERGENPFPPPFLKMTRLSLPRSLLAPQCPPPRSPPSALLTRCPLPHPPILPASLSIRDKKFGSCSTSVRCPHRLPLPALPCLPPPLFQSAIKKLSHFQVCPNNSSWSPANPSHRPCCSTFPNNSTGKRRGGGRTCHAVLYMGGRGGHYLYNGGTAWSRCRPGSQVATHWRRCQWGGKR